MLTLNAFGKHGSELVKFLQSSLKDDETELKILIDGSIHVEEIRKFLEPLNFANFILEDDDGNLYLMTSKNLEESEPAATSSELNQALKAAQPQSNVIQTSVAAIPKPIAPEPIKPTVMPIATHKPTKLILQHSTGVLISCDNGKYKKNFMQKILISLVASKIKPEILALMNAAVSLAAYNSKSCDYLKELEAAGVKILISESCADYLGITEAIGAGTAVDMSEIFEEIFSCERIVNF